jgi:hypothetical protein
MNSLLLTLVSIVVLCLSSGAVTAVAETQSPIDLLSQLMKSTTSQVSFFVTEQRIPVWRSPPRAVYQDEEKAIFTILENPATYAGKPETVCFKILENPATYVGRPVASGSDDFYPVGIRLIDLDSSAVVLINKEKIWISIDQGERGQEVRKLSATGSTQIFNWFGPASVRHFGLVDLNASDEIPDDQLPKVKAAALSGDVAACTRLYNYYAFIKDDDLQTEKWMHLAADYGDVTAQYNLGFLYEVSPKLKDIHLAKYWLQKAAQNGNANAKAELRSIKAD